MHQTYLLELKDKSNPILQDTLDTENFFAYTKYQWSTF